MMTIKAAFLAWGKIWLLASLGVLAAFLSRGEYTLKAWLQLVGHCIIASMAAMLVTIAFPAVASLPGVALAGFTGLVGAITMEAMHRTRTAKISVKIGVAEFESNGTEAAVVKVEQEK
jgi:hypothetical protein